MKAKHLITMLRGLEDFDLKDCGLTTEILKSLDAEPVKHGHWIVDKDPQDGDVRCSECTVCIDALHEKNWARIKALGGTLETYYRYCPNCGAKMEV